MATDDFGQSAAAVRAELKDLEDQLQRADARGDRRTALKLLSRMLELQRKFMDRWQANPPGRSGNTPDSV